MGLAEWTFVMAAAAVAVGLLPLLIRHWDRVDLRIEEVIHEGDRLVVRVRNRGATPSRDVRIVSDKGYVFDYARLSVLAGRSNNKLTLSVPLLARDPWRDCPPFRLVDDSGNHSPIVSFPSTVKAHLEDLIRVSPQIAQ